MYGQLQRRNRNNIWLADIIAKLIDICTYKSVAEKADIPTTSMQIFFDNANYPHISEILIRPFNSLNDADKHAVNIMLLYSADIMGAHCLKEKFFTALRSSAEQA